MAPLALGAAPEGDPYSLALLLSELVLREAGWNVRNLGPNLPLRSLAEAVADYRPTLVFLAVNYLAERDDFVREYERFYEMATSRQVAVMVGGHALDADLRARLVYAGYAERLAHLSEFARRVGAATDRVPPRT